MSIEKKSAHITPADGTVRRYWALKIGSLGQKLIGINIQDSIDLGFLPIRLL